jgi:hypothetical protein
MGTAINSYPIAAKVGNSLRLAGVLRRAPLAMMTVIFTLISFRFLAHPARYAAEAGINFTSQSGVTIARVGFGAFPLFPGDSGFRLSHFRALAPSGPLHGVDRG